MNKILIGLAVFCYTTAFSQVTDGVISKEKPQTVYSIAKEVKEISWYETQLKLWKAEIDMNNKNGEAWTNYYLASRALKNLSAHNSDEKKKYVALCAQIVTDVQKAMPNTFDAYYLAYSETGVGGPVENLKKAEAINANDPRILDDLMIRYLVDGNNPKFEEYAVKLFETNEMPVAMLSWGYNLLSELDENAVLFTCGDNDTYSAWIVSAAKKFRKDVTVVNTSLIHIDDYRKRVLEEMGYPALEVTASDETPDGWKLKSKAIYDHFFNGKRPVYVATTAIELFEEDYGDKLFLTGLAYKYSTSGFDNESVVRRNYEKRYLLDYLKEVFAYNIGDLKGEEFNGTYLPSMILLYQQYARSEETAKMTELQVLLLKIAEQNGRQNEVIELLSNTEKPTLMLSAVLDLKELEKNMIKVKGNVYMDRYETTQGDYNRFLQNLKRSGNNAQYSACLYDSTQWTKKFPYAGNDPMVELYHWHPAYVTYPVVNISYESAKAYCEWLTKQYNLQRKRTYTQVVFRLPTQEEWRTAAGSGNPKAITPFPNNQIKNASGCYLGNIQTSPGRYFDDGGFHMVKVSSYNPNERGFFNTLGNVAEMTSTKGKVIGGSWYNLFEDCTFDKTMDISGPDPGVGFRVVMEIIEE